MAEKTTRRPSTLSAARAQSAARPLGASELSRPGALDVSPAAGGLARGPIHQSTRPQPKVLNRPSANTTGKFSVSSQASSASITTAIAVAKGTAPSTVPTANGGPRAKPATRTKTAVPRAADGARDSGERRVVIGVVSAFLVAAAFLMSMNSVSSGDESRAKERLGESFAQVHERQAEFRVINGRFASWPELKQRGVELGPRQTVREWNADASHWFISIRDTETGVICDRTGELFDESAAERDPVCRTLKQP